MSRLRRAAIAALLLLLLPAAAAPPFPRAATEAVLAEALGAILEWHLEPTAPAELGLWTLRGLEAVDPALRAELRAGTLLLGTDAGLLGARPVPSHPPDAPAEAAAPALAAALGFLFEAAWQRSPALQRAGAERLLQSSFAELFSHLDPYSRYLTIAEAAAARERRLGPSALGLVLDEGQRGEIRVAAVTPGMAAARAGLRVGDVLVGLEGARLGPGGLAAVIAALAGPEGSVVALRVRRAGGGIAALRLRREATAPATVRAERRDGLLVLRVDGFAAATDRQLAAALAVALDGGQPPLRGVVLDLRGNRGGLLAQAVGVAQLFLDGGRVVATEGRHPDARRDYLAVGPDLAAALPLAVLVDGRTASAAEIVAAALGDRGRAVVIGSATQGKGLVQLVVPLPNGAELLVSWARILAPGGWSLQGLGVLPAVCTAQGGVATAAGIAALRGGEAPMLAALRRKRAFGAAASAAETAALRAGCPPGEGGEADEAAARAIFEAGAAVAERRGGLGAP